MGLITKTNKVVSKLKKEYFLTNNSMKFYLNNLRQVN
jgi:hypothetical protein